MSDLSQDERQRHLDRIVEDATRCVVEGMADHDPLLQTHFFYGATSLDPTLLVTWYLYRNDREWDEADRRGLVREIDFATRRELTARGYPEEGVRRANVSFSSLETIERETNGNPAEYFR